MARKRKGATKAENEIIRRGKIIEEVMSTKGWKELIEPVFDEMIESVIGRKRNGRWFSGHFVKSRKDEKKEFYIGYTSGIQELWNSIHNYVDAAEVTKKRIKERGEEEKQNKAQVPMINDESEEEEGF